MNRHITRFLLGVVAALLLAQLLSLPARSAIPQSPAPSLAQISDPFSAGLTHYSAGRYAEAIEAWQRSLTDPRRDRPLDQALVRVHLSLAHQHLNQWPAAQQQISAALALIPASPIAAARDVLGKAQLAQGNLLWHQGSPTEALETWRQAEATFAALNDLDNQLGCRINQARALQTMGFALQAADTLEATAPLLQRPAVSPQARAAGLQNLGRTYRQLGQLMAARSLLEQSLAIAPEPSRSPILLELGNTALAQAKRARATGQAEATWATQAQVYYQQAEDTASTALESTQAQANALALAVWQGEGDGATARWRRLQPQLSALPVSRSALQVRLQALQTVSQQRFDLQTAQFAARSLQQARALANPRLEAQALGQLSELYSAAGQAQPAKDLTQQAIALADSINATDIRYRWEWQLGRLLKRDWEASGRQSAAIREAAIAAYGAAFKSLDGVRQDLVGIDAEVQFSFESNISPLYRELADLLLSPSAGEPVTPEDLDQAISVLDLLQRVELENYLRCNLSQTLQISETAIDPTAAIIYPIVLPERLEVIAILPDGSRRHYTQPVGSKAVKALAQQIKQDTLKPFISAEGEARSQQLYNWLISPVQADLAAAQIRTLVFVLGSVLRDVPLAALYNGHHYLIEDYAVAIAPGLQLVRPAPLQAVDPEVLAFGLSEMQPDLTAHAGFSDLQYVAAELQEIEAQVDSQQFINAAFNTGNFAAQVQALPFPIIHLATHGQFSSDPEQTFILTWNKRLNIDQISQIFRQRDETTSDPVELLVLSACETATGDRRAALGLAGIAVQSGARSTIASLWQVDDRAAAELMSGLYAQLSQPQETISRAEALRQAQLALLKSDRYRVPAFWAAFMLVGNWL